MKTLFTLFLTTVFITSFGQGDTYEKAMLSAIERMNKSANTIDFLEAANIFERISQTEKTEWLPLYHAAYSYIIVCHMEQDLAKKDPYLDKAQQFLDKAFAIAPDESELYSLQAFLYPGRMVVDPMTRGMEYLGKMNMALDKAIHLNPENPRSYYLRAITLLNLPESLGGGVTKARPLFETAKQKFDKFQPVSSISPNWGKEINETEFDKL